jgi:hypothetical protein
VACLLLALPGSAQSALPRERELLVKITQRMKQNLSRLPDYTCVETITRSRRPPRSLVVARHGGPGPFRREDTVRLEVAAVDGQEFFAWPGGRDFHETDISVFVPGGLIGNGHFTQFARNVFEPSIASYQFAGEEKAGGRPLLRYDFQVSLLLSGFQIKTNFGEAKVAYSGSFWADPVTFDASRLDILAGEIPPHLGVVSAATRIDYAEVRLAAQDVLLPQSADMTLLNYAGWESRNQIAFTHCKEYGAESVISFEAPRLSPAAAPPIRRTEIPGGLAVVLRLETALDSDLAAAGDLIRATVEADVRRKGALLIPKDTIVSGRIRRLDQYLEPSRRFEIALEFSRFEFPADRLHFFATLEKIFPPPGLPRLSLIPTDLPGVATFWIPGDRFRLAPGTRMLWRTVVF